MTYQDIETVETHLGTDDFGSRHETVQAVVEMVVVFIIFFGSLVVFLRVLLGHLLCLISSLRVGVRTSVMVSSPDFPYGWGRGYLGHSDHRYIIDLRPEKVVRSTVSTVMKMATVLQKSLPSDDNIKRHSQVLR